MGQVVVELATPADEQGLRRLFAETTMEGPIEVSFQREPNFFLGTTVQGKFAQVGVARDVETGTIIGSGTRTTRPAYVNGEPREVGYLADLRLRREYRGGTLVARAYRHLRRLHEDRRTDIYFTAIFEQNRVALRTIASGRAGLPTYHPMGGFYSFVVSLRGPRTSLNARQPPEIVKGSPDLLPEIVACLNRNGKRRQFAPFCCVEDFLAPDRWLRDFRVEDFYVALDCGQVRGVLGKWDQRGFKQSVVVGYHGRFARFRPVLNLAARLLGYPSYPPPGSPLQFFYGSFIAIDDDDPGVFTALLERVCTDARGGDCAYFVVGLAADDPLVRGLHGFRRVGFRSQLFCVCYEDGEATFRQLDGRVPHVEIAML